MVVHDWPAWVDPRFPVTGPPLVWGRIDTAVPHYTAAVDLPDGDLGEFVTQLPAYFRAIQRMYLNRKPKGYSIGYTWGVDWLGGIWRLRGWGIQCAANRGHNDHCVAILCLVDGADPVTAEAAASIRWLIGEAEVRANRLLRIMDHGRLPIPPGVPTGCAGAGIRHQVDLGIFSPHFHPPQPPTPPTPAIPVTALLAAASGDDMIRFIQDQNKPMTDPFRWASNGLVKMTPTAEQAAWIIQQGLASNTLTTPDRLPLAVINHLPSIN